MIPTQYAGLPRLTPDALRDPRTLSQLEAYLRSLAVIPGSGIRVDPDAAGQRVSSVPTQQAEYEETPLHVSWDLTNEYFVIKPNRNMAFPLYNRSRLTTVPSNAILSDNELHLNVSGSNRYVYFYATYHPGLTGNVEFFVTWYPTDANVTSDDSDTENFKRTHIRQKVDTLILNDDGTYQRYKAAANAYGNEWKNMLMVHPRLYYSPNTSSVYLRCAGDYNPYTGAVFGSDKSKAISYTGSFTDLILGFQAGSTTGSLDILANSGLYEYYWTVGRIEVRADGGLERLYDIEDTYAYNYQSQPFQGKTYTNLGVSDATSSHTLSDASLTALRDNTKSAVDALGAKINEILAKLDFQNGILR